jgi:hypothetical protein
MSLMPFFSFIFSLFSSSINQHSSLFYKKHPSLSTSGAPTLATHPFQSQSHSPRDAAASHATPSAIAAHPGGHWRLGSGDGVLVGLSSPFLFPSRVLLSLLSAYFFPNSGGG